MATRVGGLLLAAGPGRRFGGPKGLAPWGGTTLAGHGVDVLAAGGCEPVLVVVGAAGRAVAAVLPPRASVVWVPDWTAGMGASLRAGLRAAEQLRLDAVVVVPVDTPLVAAAAVERLVAAAAEADGTMALQASYDGTPGHPVLLPRSVWPAVSALSVGDTGARGWIRANQPQVRKIDCTGTGSSEDADTKGDLLRLWDRRGEYKAGRDHADGDHPAGERHPPSARPGRPHDRARRPAGAPRPDGREEGL